MLGKFALQEFWQNVCENFWHCNSSGRAFTAGFRASESFSKRFAAHNGPAKVLAELMLGKFALQEFWQNVCENFWHCKSSGRASTAGLSASESFGRTFAAHYGLAKVLT